MVYYIINRYTVLYLPERRIKMIYNIGEYIKNRRKVLGITQDELADGICSVMTLSRIERGDQFPHDYTLIQILQRLGLSGSEMFLLVNSEQFIISQLRFDIRQAYIQENYDEAKRFFEKTRIRYPNSLRLTGKPLKQLIFC